MAARREAAVAVLLSIALSMLAVGVTATPPSKQSEVDPSAFRPIAVQPVRPPLGRMDSEGADDGGGLDLHSSLPVLRPDRIADAPDDLREVGIREPDVVDVPVDPTPSPVPRVRATPAPRSPRPSGAHRVSGAPTWYCNQRDPDYVRSRCTRGYPDQGGSQFYAAAGPALRVGDWRGRVVSVTAGDITIEVTLVDYCACGGGHFLDLYLDAWKALGGPGRATARW